MYFGCGVKPMSDALKALLMILGLAAAAVLLVLVGGDTAGVEQLPEPKG